MHSGQGLRRLEPSSRALALGAAIRGLPGPVPSSRDPKDKERAKKVPGREDDFCEDPETGKRLIFRESGKHCVSERGPAGQSAPWSAMGGAGAHGCVPADCPPTLENSTVHDKDEDMFL